jgi:D-lactate dehydrogenase (cytochrome)
MSERRKLSSAARKALFGYFEPGQVLSRPNELENYDRDASELRIVPEFVLRARCREDVQNLFRLADCFDFPIIPRGGGTGLAGGCLAFEGGVVLSLEEMNRIRRLDEKNLIAVVEPGVTTEKLKNAAREKGLFYPPDPAGLDQSTIGGNAATNAGGPACVKYGTTRDYILGLEVLLPNGKLVHTGVSTRKGVVGYDLTHLMVGSEGTLGVITALTLKLIPYPQAVAGMAVVFPDMAAATRAVEAVMAAGYLPFVIEFMDHRCLHLMRDRLPFAVTGSEAMLLVEMDGPETQVAEGIRAVGDIFRRRGALRLLPAADDTERERLWEVRRAVSLCIHDTAGLYMSEDVVVPVSRIADLVSALPAFEKKYNLMVYAFGHAGDGNIHLNITADGPERKADVDAGIREILGVVLQMGGTISGEHGIGLAKRPFIAMELSPENLDLQKGIKRVFDPRGILNPGKIFPN